MAQVTGAVAQSVFQVEVSANGSTWTDVSGAATSVSVSGGDIPVGEQFTADGEEAIVTTSNKNGPRDITVRCVYTEGASDAWKTVWDVYIGASKLLAVRWAPEGDTAGNNQFSTAVAGAAAVVPLVNCTFPEHDASSGDPMLFEFTVRAPGIVSAAISA